MNYSDEYIDYWGDIYTAANLRVIERFDDFLKNPLLFLKAKISLAAKSETDEPLGADVGFFDLALAASKDETTELTEVKGRVVELHGDRLIQPLHKRQKVRAWKTNTNRSTHS